MTTVMRGDDKTWVITQKNKILKLFHLIHHPLPGMHTVQIVFLQYAPEMLHATICELHFLVFGM